MRRIKDLDARKIIDIINERLSLLATVRYGFVYPVTQERKDGVAVYLYTMSNLKIEEPVTLDDSKSMVYHRLGGTSRETDYEQGKGSAFQVTLTFPITTVLFYPNVKKNISPQWVLDQLNIQLLKPLTPQQRADFKIRDYRVTINDSNSNAFEVTENQFPGLKNKLRTEDVLISVEWSSILVYYSNCVEELCSGG